MGRELDSEMLQRLQAGYAAMSDGELLDLAAAPDDLTAMALEVLRGEMTRRGLKAEPAKPQRLEPEHTSASDRMSGIAAAASGVPTAILGYAPALDMAQPELSGTDEGESLLGRFHDALEVGRACEFLEAAEVPFRVEDVAKPRNGMGMYDSPPVAINLIVSKDDRERAMQVLREKMGLFPLQEVEEADATVDDGTVSTLGDFARREEAEPVEHALDEAGIWHRLVLNEEGSVETEDAFRLEVKEVDLMRAGDVVEKAMGLG
jgi:hypothetical protein